jgi:hypothetical protein
MPAFSFSHSRLWRQILSAVCFTMFAVSCLAQPTEQNRSSKPATHEILGRIWAIRLSLFAGHDLAAIINQRFVASFGASAGVQTASGVYLGSFASIHPLVINGSPAAYVAPIVVGGEVGYEFVLSQQSFLRPTIGIGRFGIGESYRGERLSYIPASELWVAKLGVLYSYEISPDLLIGAELFLLGQVGIRPAIHVGFRL